MKWIILPLALTLAVSAGAATAQQPTEPPKGDQIGRSDVSPPATAQRPSERAGSAEAGAKVADTNPATAEQPHAKPKTEQIQQTNPLPPATGRTLSEQGGKTEPGAKVPGTNPDPNVLAKGVLTVPGANTDVDTAPAKFSARTDADDQIPIAGYRFKLLSPEQLQEIRQALSSERDAPTTEPADGDYAILGAGIPAPVARESLTPVKGELTQKFAELRGTAYMRSAGKILIVDRDDNIVVGVLED